MKKTIKAVWLLLILGLTFSALGCQGGGSRRTLVVYNWGDYIEESIIDEFEDEYGVDVIYDMYTTNEDMYAKLKSGGVAYDIVVPSDYMVERLIKEDMLLKIDMSKITNYKYIGDQYKNQSYDPNNEYTVPYMWGTVGILYNKTMVDEPVDSWNILWNEKYKKNIFMLDSQRDAIGVALKKLGYSLNTRDEAQLEEAKNALIDLRPQILAYGADEIKDKMIANEAALAVVWAGDAVVAKNGNPDLDYAIPKEGTNIWIDSLAIPKTSKNKADAELFIDFVTRPDIAKRNTEYIGYSTPNTEAWKLLPDNVKYDKTAYPDEASLQNSEVFDDLSDIIGIYNRMWDEIKAQ